MKNTDEVSVQGKIALVTGAAKGIGRACALALAEAGAAIATNASTPTKTRTLQMARLSLPVTIDSNLIALQAGGKPAHGGPAIQNWYSWQ